MLKRYNVDKISHITPEHNSFTFRSDGVIYKSFYQDKDKKIIEKLMRSDNFVMTFKVNMDPSGEIFAMLFHSVLQ